MLVLSRKRGESVLIQVGDITIRVVVTTLGDGKVKLGFEAPQKVAIVREEIADRQEGSDGGAD